MSEAARPRSPAASTHLRATWLTGRGTACRNRNTSRCRIDRRSSAAAAVRAAQRDGPLLPCGDHRLLNRRRGRDRPAARGRGQREDDEDDDEEERDTDERRESQGKERRRAREGEGDRGDGEDPDDDREDEADGHGVRRRTARNRRGEPDRGGGWGGGHAARVGRDVMKAAGAFPVKTF